MLCLNCHQPLSTVQENHFLEHLTYEVCGQCGGLWLDKGGLDKLAVQTSGSVEFCSVTRLHEEPHKHHYSPFPPFCLRCSAQRMTKMHFMGETRILLDFCEACGGIWVDGGELNKINQYIKWFDKKAKPSLFGRFLKNAHGTLL